jgi:hypothetical protein
MVLIPLRPTILLDLITVIYPLGMTHMRDFTVPEMRFRGNFWDAEIKSFTINLKHFEPHYVRLKTAQTIVVDTIPTTTSQYTQKMNLILYFD